MASKPSLVLKRRLKAPAEKVYQAWTHPEQMTRWWGVTDSPKPPSPRPTCAWAAASACSSGAKDEHHSVSGTYREVVPNRKLAFSWAWQSTPERESKVTIELNPVADGTMLTLTHEQFFSEKARDDHRVGWDMVSTSWRRSLL